MEHLLALGALDVPLMLQMKENRLRPCSSPCFEPRRWDRRSRAPC
jgi:hypothetical protein